MTGLVPSLADLITESGALVTAFAGIVVLVGGIALAKFGVNFVTSKVKRAAK